MRRDDIRRLHEQRANVHGEMRSLVNKVEEEDRSFTAEEAQEFEKLQADFEELRTRAKNAEDVYLQEREVEKALHAPVELRHADGEEVPLTLAEWRTQKGITKTFDTPEYRAAYFHYMTAKSLSELDVEEQRVLSKATAGAGANLVPTSFYDQIINILRFTGPFQELANVITTDSGEALQVPSVSAHGVATWTAENASYTTSDETFGQVTLNAYKAGRTTIVSEELLTDAAFGLEGYLAQEFGDSIGVLEETAFATGDGTGKPLGIATTGNGVTVSQAATGNSTSFTYAAMAAFAFALPYQYRRNAVWVFSDAAVRNLYTMVDSQQRPLWNVNVANTGPDTFLGYPVYTSPDLAAPAISAKSGVFGDIRRAYTVRRVNGFSMQRQNELYSNNGQVGFRGFERVDGRLFNTAAVIVLQNSAT